MRGPTAKEIALATVVLALLIAGVAVVFPGFLPSFVRVFEFLDKYGNAFVAVGTIAIAVFTFALWWSTDRLWKAGESQLAIAKQAADAATLSAQATVGVELPLFAIESVNINQNSDYRIVLKNYGRTQAIVVEDCLVTQISTALDPSPRYPMHSLKSIGKDVVVGNEGAYEIFRRPSLNEEGLTRVREGTESLWAYGYIRYLDFMKVERSEGFCLGFTPTRQTRAEKMYPTMSPTSLGWERAGPPAYTYSKIGK